MALHTCVPQDPLLAARMLGAVGAALACAGLAVEPIVKFFHAQTLAKARAALGETAFRSALEEGSRWTRAQAVRRALEEDD